MTTISEKPDPDLDAIKRFIVGKDKSEIKALRDRIAAEVTTLFAGVNARMGDAATSGDPFKIQRQRSYAVRRRRQVDYLDNHHLCADT
jgi:hypothetical protein